MPLNEADTCRKLVTPKLLGLGWDDASHQIAEQHVFTDGRSSFMGTVLGGDVLSIWEYSRITLVENLDLMN